MTADSPEELRAALSEARQTINRQAQELAFAQQLREALSTASAAATIGSPIAHTRLLEMIVETAAHVISANAGALLLKDEEADELVFEVAVGGKAEDVKRFRVPLGHGVAGLVALTGQPMSIGNDEEGGTQSAQDIASSVGYQPQNILCVPLFYGDDVIGVLELMDKQGAAGFDAEDMEALSLFANQAAVAIEQSKVHQSVTGILREALSTLEIEGEGLQEEASLFAAEVEEDETYRQTLELARLVQQVSRRGERERQACEAILSAFATYIRAQSPASTEAPVATR